jgi:Flp pilus assembly protein TadG
MKEGNMLRKLWSQSGQSLLEVALLTPFLLLLMLGVIEIGRFAYIGILVDNAARAGAAYAAQSAGQSADGADIETAAKSDFQNNGQNVSDLTVTPNASTTTPTTSCGCDSSGILIPQACAGTGADGLPAGTCPAGQSWVVNVTVTASGSFNPIFQGFFPPMTITRACTLRVAVPTGGLN